MFAFLRRDSRRDIFQYWDGSKYRRCDPLVAWRALWEDPEVDPKLDFELATGLNAQGESVDYDPAAQDRVIGLIRKIFDVTAWTETTAGLTVNETFALLWEFLRYVNAMKKKREQTPMQSPPTELKSSADASTTPPDLDSSSTKDESTSAEQPSTSKRSVVL